MLASHVENLFNTAAVKTKPKFLCHMADVQADYTLDELFANLKMMPNPRCDVCLTRKVGSGMDNIAKYSIDLRKFFDNTPTVIADLICNFVIDNFALDSTICKQCLTYLYSTTSLKRRR